MTPLDVLDFVRSVSRHGGLTFANFMELLSPPDEEEGAEGAEGAVAEGAPAGAGAPPAPVRQRSRVVPKGEEELSELLSRHVDEEQRAEAELAKVEAEQRERARQQLEEQLRESDYGWSAPGDGGSNPRICISPPPPNLPLTLLAPP